MNSRQTELEDGRSPQAGRATLASHQAPAGLGHAEGIPNAMRFAYADPPYLGQGVKHYGKLHTEAADCDDPEWHRALIERLCDEFPDGWALSLHTPSLRTILNMCPADVRVCAWVKPFAAFKKNVTRAYAWEPVIVRGGRKIPVEQPTVRDFVSEPIAMRKGFPGAKPYGFSFWLFSWLNLKPEDEFIDLFPGSGAVMEAYRHWIASPSLFGEAA